MNHNVSKKKGRIDRWRRRREVEVDRPGRTTEVKGKKKISWGEGKCENAEIKITRRNPIPSAKTDVYSE